MPFPKSKHNSRAIAASPIALGLSVFAVLAVIFSAIAIASAAISSDNANSPAVPVITDTPDIGIGPSMVQLDGQWSVNENDVDFSATVANESITISMSREGTTMIYWLGTFEHEKASGETVLSNKIETDKIVLSRVSSKNFVVGNDTLSFEFQAMGMTKTVTLNRA